MTIRRHDRGLGRILWKLQKIRTKIAGYRNNPLYVFPGHYYSPIPNLPDIRKNADRIFAPFPREIPAIDLREQEQLALLKEFLPYYRDLPFPEHRTPGHRYFYENGGYSYSDAIFLYSVIRHVKPKRIFEVGSGYSSLVTMDTNERFFDNRIEFTCIEPYPQAFYSLTTESDRKSVRLVVSNLQDLPLSDFSSLEENDILFIDSTHVVKVDSDVNYIFSRILPSLARGVYIHFHDIFYPFEYPREWVFDNMAWNELYMLRAFLEYNETFRIAMFNTFLEHFHEAYFREHMPLCLKNPGGSIWLQKIREG